MEQQVKTKRPRTNPRTMRPQPHQARSQLHRAQTPTRLHIRAAPRTHTPTSHLRAAQRPVQTRSGLALLEPNRQ